MCGKPSLIFFGVQPLQCYPSFFVARHCSGPSRWAATCLHRWGACNAWQLRARIGWGKRAACFVDESGCCFRALMFMKEEFTMPFATALRGPFGSWQETVSTSITCQLVWFAQWALWMCHGSGQRHDPVKKSAPVPSTFFTFQSCVIIFLYRYSTYQYQHQSISVKVSASLFSSFFGWCCLWLRFVCDPLGSCVFKRSCACFDQVVTLVRPGLFSEPVKWFGQFWARPPATAQSWQPFPAPVSLLKAMWSTHRMAWQISCQQKIRKWWPNFFKSHTSIHWHGSLGMILILSTIDIIDVSVSLTTSILWVYSLCFCLILLLSYWYDSTTCF